MELMIQLNLHNKLSTSSAKSIFIEQAVPLKWIDELATVCKKHSLPIHMDGARLFNACEYLKESPARVVRDCASVSVCFSKGLSAPVGSALVGSYHFIEQ